MSLIQNVATVSWEVQDLGQKSQGMVTPDVIRMIGTRELGIYAKVRRMGDSQWMPIYQVPEFHALCPFINSNYALKAKIMALNGTVTISNDLQRLAEVSGRIRAGQNFYTNVGFHAPIFDQQIPASISVPGKIFRLWENFWVGPIVTPGQVSIGDPNASFLLYLFVMNTSTGNQSHELHPYDYPIPREELGNLVFGVPAGGFAVNKVRIPVAKDKGVGVHNLTFRNRTTAEKIGKGLLVGAVSLGSVAYKQGHRGFTIGLRVAPPTVNLVTAHGAVSLVAPQSRLFCWCGRPLTNLYCEGCSSRPFACQCYDGSSTKVSEQFGRLPKLVQEGFRSTDLSQIWQKTPADLTAEERASFGLVALQVQDASVSFEPKSQSSAPTIPAVSESTPISSAVDSTQAPTPLTSPVLRITKYALSASLGEPVDLDQVAKAFPGAARCSWTTVGSEGPGGGIYHFAVAKGAPQSKDSPLDLGLPWPARFIYESGRIVCPIAKSEEQGREAIEEVVRDLRQRGFKINNEPIIRVDGVGPAALFLGRGIIIESLPDHVPNSLYAQRTGQRIEGKYNRAGQIIRLTSEEDLVRGLSELIGLHDGRTKVSSLPYVAYCRFGTTPVIGEMLRSEDLEGNMWRTGYVRLSEAKTEAEMREVAHSIETTFGQAGLLGPLTPLDKVHEDYVAESQAELDQLANDPEVWGEE